MTEQTASMPPATIIAADAHYTNNHRFELEKRDTYLDVDVYYTNEHRLRIGKDGYLPMLM